MSICFIILPSSYIDTILYPSDEFSKPVISAYIFGSRDEQPAISATKAFIGHTLGASGTIEAIVCADSICHNTVHGNICGTIIDGINYTPETRSLRVDRAVSASFGFGGHNAAIMLERYEKNN